MRRYFDLKSTTFLLFFISLISLGVINNVAVILDLYWQYPWLDIPMHALGGVVVALGVLSVYPLHCHRTFRDGVVWTLVLVFLVGALWEGFEFFVALMTGNQFATVADTVLDLVMDLVGGGIAYVVAHALSTLDAVTDDTERGDDNV